MDKGMNEYVNVDSLGASNNEFFSFDVHRKCIFKYNQQDATLHNVFISVNCSTRFRWVLRP
jgi:hypothetical protein